MPPVFIDCQYYLARAEITEKNLHKSRIEKDMVVLCGIKAVPLIPKVHKRIDGRMKGPFAVLQDLVTFSSPSNFWPHVATHSPQASKLLVSCIKCPHVDRLRVVNSQIRVNIEIQLAQG